MRRIKRLMAIAAAVILMTAVCTGCSSAGRSGADPAVANNRSLGSSPAPVPEGWSGIKSTGSMELLYADQFSVDYYDGGYAMITIKDSGRYLVVPEGKSQPSGLPGDVAVIKQPLENIYLAATSAMDLFCSLDGTDRITLSEIGRASCRERV